MNSRRASDRYRDGDGMARERRYAVGIMAAIIYKANDLIPDTPDDADQDTRWIPMCVDEAEAILAEVERRDLERQQKGHEALTERKDGKQP